MFKKTKTFLLWCSNERGAVLALTAFILFALIGVAAFTIDFGHLYVVRNELQNAADAGALAGAGVLYADPDGAGPLLPGSEVNTGANQVAYDTATANLSDNAAVDLNWTSPSGNDNDVQRGHWRFKPNPETLTEADFPSGTYFYPDATLNYPGADNYTGTFSPNSSSNATDLWGKTDEELNNDFGFINSVRVAARREDKPALSFFAGIFGFKDFIMAADAVAYLGFAGTLGPGEAEQPIAICKQSILEDDGTYSCNTGRMIDSSDTASGNTAAWTNFSQPCQTANNTNVGPLICGSGNPNTLNLGDGIGTTGGMVNPTYESLRDCWLNNGVTAMAEGYPIEPWTQTLPVIDCPGNNPGPCSDVVGAVTVNFLWVKQSGADPNWYDVPVQMSVEGVNWECSTWVGAGKPPNFRTNAYDPALRQTCWEDFASTFNLETADGTSVGDLSHAEVQKTMYFLPSCEKHEPAGRTGGHNFGVLSKRPVLVE